MGSQSRSRQLSLLGCEGNPFDRVWPPTNSVTYNPSSLRLTPRPPPHFACKFSKLTDRGAGGVEEHRADSVATRTRDPHEPAGPASRHANSSCTTHQEQGYYVCGLELRSLNLIYLVSRAMAFPHDLSDHGSPIWIGKGDDDKDIFADRRSKGTRGWPISPAIQIPLYRRTKSRTGEFEIFAVLNMRHILHAVFLAELLCGGYPMWYYGIIDTKNATGANPYQGCMIGEFLHLENPVVMGHPAGYAALVVGSKPREDMKTRGGSNTKKERCPRS